MIRKMENLNLFLLLFALPFGTRKFLGCFLDLGKVGSEFTSAFIYATDFLILSLLVFWGLRITRDGKKKAVPNLVLFQKSSLFVGLFLVVATLSVLSSSYLKVGGYSLLR